MKNYLYFKPFKLREKKSYINPVGLVLKHEISINLEFFYSMLSKDVSTSCSRWKSKDSLVVENCKNLNSSLKNVSLDWILKIEVFPSHQLLETCCTIFFTILLKL